ncbi:serine/threonine-protein kinase [Melittangium boletus]|uniref:Serine/threonine protein kinase n=1 Tax=Melittangium boletus DSM 14713 TaxID=1294270 RepID=A0A250IFN8_9BACT|nr:serine/threonine-protein kinase [Melittangium boletus]ATB29961.1 serine/threonine protein kinase [Melittangium boletus DSM 14713]
MSDPSRGSPFTSTDFTDPHRGSRIGRYQVISQLSVGGMAELFLGFTSGPGGFRKYAAIKRILPDARSDEQFERMFLDEARITAALNHPNIGQVFELGQDAEGLFLAMEFIAGQNLAQVISVCGRSQTPLPLGFGLSVVRDICLALHSAHAFTTPGGKPFPVIHRDVAHKNVMVTYQGEVKLLDFGIAKARGGASHTQAGMVKGTTGYMSPEQVRGDPLDGRSDLFAAGVMLHELITGERLFSGNSEVQEMQMILDAEIPEPVCRTEAMPPGLAGVVLKALSRPREGRYANGREMARAIEAAAGGRLFDAEQRAAFMAEHFQKQKENTLRLLESADEIPDAPEALGGAPVAKTEPRPVAAPRRKPVAASNETSQGVMTTGRRVPTREQPVVVAPPPRSSDKPSGKGGPAVAKVLLFLLVAGGLGLAAVGLMEVDRSGVDVATRLTPEELSPITPIDPPRGKEPAESAPKAPVEEPPERPDADEPPARTGKQGWLTLVVLPEAEVTLNGRSLGKTPLFKVQVPAGQHRLRIKGADGKRRELSVPIAAGKTAQFKLALTDIPER